MIIANYFSDYPVCALRIWFHYFAEDFLGIRSITFTINGKDYTFSQVGDKELLASYDTYIEEFPNIIFGKNNNDFLLELFGIGESLIGDNNAIECTIPVVFT